MQQISLTQKVTENKMDGLKKDTKAKMDGLKKGLEAKMDGLKKGVEDKMNDVEEKMDDMEAKMDDMQAKTDDLKTYLTNFLQEIITNGERVVKETHDENKINANHDFIDSNIGLKNHHVPKIDMRKFDGKDPGTWIL